MIRKGEFRGRQLSILYRSNQRMDVMLDRALIIRTCLQYVMAM